ncbi:hypothetical protein HY989_06845 [Candidatus Micrarchaeota archaeon]|nr:hypothetical protein [Candidatus Micrarchaeota archaeon]
MVLDAPTFKLVLTPESALGSVQKELNHKGWKKFEVEEIRLIYAPYYLFSFDVKSEGGSPPVAGKAALNAYTGEISDFVPMVLERPLQKQKNIEEGGEVEDTSISMQEAKQAARDKIAAQTGLKSEMVSVSAFTKYYMPFFRIWLEVGHESMKIDVDALMGAPLGLEAAPERKKTWDEATSETIGKLKTPQGWVELTGKAIGAVSGAGSSGGHGDAHGGGGDASGHGNTSGGGGIGGFQQKWLILGALILLLVYLVFLKPTSDVNCSGEISYSRDGCILEGICKVSAKTVDDRIGKGAEVFVKEDGKERLDLKANVNFFDGAQSSFNVTFEQNGKDCKQYGWGYRKV